MAALEYCEIWSDFQAAGGARVNDGFLPTPVEAEDDIGVDGLARASAAWPKSLPHTASLVRGRVLRFTFADETWQEWEIERVQIASGADDLLVRVALVPVWDRLRRVPVRLVDGDGFVYSDVPAVQLTPATILSDILLADAPAWLVAGTVTPTDTQEVQFNRDNALSGLVKLCEHLRTEYAVTPNGTTEYQVHIGPVGSGATPVRIRTGKNLVQLVRESGGEQVTRVAPHGAQGDDGLATLAWAYWTVLGVSGSLVELGPMHGSGPGPIAFDDQFNHANLGATWYLVKDDGTLTEITDSAASTQEVEVDDATGISTGDRVRIVASSTGQHVVELDAPAELATDGVRFTEGFTSPWDDTVNILDNPIMLTYTNPSARPDSYGGSIGTWAKETGAGNHLTGGQSAKVTGAGVAAGLLLSKTAVWYIPKRRGTFSATMWIRITSLSSGNLSFRLTRNGTAIGEALLYRSPINKWVQLKIEGLNLTADEESAITLGFELRTVPDTSIMSVVAYVDSVQISPSFTARAITDGSNAARIWQEANAWLDEHRVAPAQYTIRAVDLERAGIPRTAAIVVGGDAIVDDEELGIAGLTARIVRRRRDLVRALLTEITASTAAFPLGRRLATPEPLTIPFFEPVQVQAAGRDTRQAAQTLKAEITDTSADEVEITLTHSDLLGGSPTILREQFGTTYVSGSGLGPYVYTRPANGAGAGQALFTSRIPGRTDVIATVEVPEQDLDVGSIGGVITANAGTFDFRLEGSASTKSWKYAVSSSGMPGDATVDAASAVNGRAVDVTGAATLDLDDTVYVKARAFSGLNGGGQAATDYIEATFRRDNITASKTLRIGFAEFFPASDAEAWTAANAGYVRPNGVAGADQDFVCSVPLPKGVTITAVRTRGFRSTSNDVVQTLFRKVTDTPTMTTLATINQTATGWATTSVTGLSQLVGDEIYFAEVQLRGLSDPADAGFLFLEVDYDVPTIVHTY